jgi:hypothetical protein
LLTWNQVEHAVGGHDIHGGIKYATPLGRNGDQLPSLLARLAQQIEVVAPAWRLIERDFLYSHVVTDCSHSRKLPPPAYPRTSP